MLQFFNVLARIIFNFFSLEEPFLYMQRLYRGSEDDVEGISLPFRRISRVRRKFYLGINYNDYRQLKDFIIPFGTEVIDSEAFSGCFSLTNITIPDSIKVIGPRSFEGCYSLTNIAIPHTHTVCVPYYKAAPYNISHT